MWLVLVSTVGSLSKQEVWGCAACTSWACLQAMWCWVSLWLVSDSTNLSLAVRRPDGGMHQCYQHPQHLSGRPSLACVVLLSLCGTQQVTLGNQRLCLSCRLHHYCSGGLPHA